MIAPKRCSTVLAMNLVIEPRVAAGPIRFGMTRNDVRAALGGTVKAFHKNFGPRLLVDDFREANLHVFYREDDTAYAVEIWRGAQPMLKGIDFFAVPYPWLLTALRGFDADLIIERRGAQSLRLSLRLWKPDPNGPLEGVYVFDGGDQQGLPTLPSGSSA
jgi:hypothetical protein